MSDRCKIPSKHQEKEAELKYYLMCIGSLVRAGQFFAVADNLAVGNFRARKPVERLDEQSLAQEALIISSVVRYGAVFKETNGKGANKLGKYGSIEDIFNKDFCAIHNRAMTFRDKAAAHIQDFSELVEIYAIRIPGGGFSDIGTNSIHCSPGYLFPDVVPHLGALIDRALEWFRSAQRKAGYELSQLVQKTNYKDDTLLEATIDVNSIAKELLESGDALLVREYKKRGLIS